MKMSLIKFPWHELHMNKGHKNVHPYIYFVWFFSFRIFSLLFLKIYFYEVTHKTHEIFVMRFSILWKFGCRVNETTELRFIVTQVLFEINFNSDFIFLFLIYFFLEYFIVYLNLFIYLFIKEKEREENVQKVLL